MVPGSLQVEVLMETSIEHARQVVPPILGKLESTEKGIILRSSTAHLTWIAHFLINLDFPVFVIQPDELRQKLRQIAARALEMAGEQSIVKTIEGGNHDSEGSSFNNN
jgi:predicted DNA-binding transcriptional regulator YafY